MSRRPLLLACGLAAATCFARPAHAQTTGSSSGTTTGSGTENINMTYPNPNRALLLNGPSGGYIDVTNNPRPQNLNPTGCNFLDCEQDLQLTFSIVYSGFSNGDSDHIEVWAGTVDCTQDNNRTGTAVPHLCWKVNAGTGPVYATSAVTQDFTIYARDVLRYEQPGNTTQPYDPNFHSSSEGPTACKVQLSDAAVPISIYFIPVTSTFTAAGTAYEWTLNADSVAPPAPTSVTLNPGDTLLQVQWTSPGNDPDIVGFAVYSDPPAGGLTTGGCACGSTPGSGANSYAGGDADTTQSDATSSSCIDSGSGSDSSSLTDAPGEAAEEAAVDAEPDAPAAPEAGMAEASIEAGMEASTSADSGKGSGIDSGASTTPDAGTTCHPVNTGGGGACASFNLTSNVYVVGGTTTTTVGDASSDVEIIPVTTGDETTGSEGGVILSGGGISQINPTYKAGEIDDITATQLTLTGLTNGLNYVVVVTSIDGSGNVGPISEPPSCKQPEPTDDYWKTYKTDGGGASGCALGAGPSAPVFAVGILAAAAGLARRRRRR